MQPAYLMGILIKQGLEGDVGDVLKAFELTVLIEVVFVLLAAILNFRGNPEYSPETCTAWSESQWRNGDASSKHYPD